MKKTKKDYRIFLSIIGMLILIGLIFIYSSSSVFALEKFGSPYYFLKKQLIGLLLGCSGLIAILCIPSMFIKKFAPSLFFCSVLATFFTLVKPFSCHIHGSSRWISLFGLTMQPSELLKIFFVLYLAYVLTKKRHRNSFTYDFLPIFIILIIPSIVLLQQPDFGLTVTLFVTTLIMLFLAHFHIRHILATLCSMIPFILFLIVIKPYRLQRIMTFLNPWGDPKGSGFQIIQSLIAIGSGGAFGLGVAQSKQKFFYLPMQHTDFIFSILAEETGFVGIVFVISLYIGLLYIGIKMAHRLIDPFAQFTLLGFVVLINLQAMINISVASGLVPTKGIGLPFISYGNSALICNIWMTGIIMNLIQGDNQ